MFERNATVGQLYKPAMKITDQTKADRYFAALVKHIKATVPGIDEAGAEKMVRENLGYFAGYYCNDTRVRVELLFGSPHPIFGACPA